MTVVEVRNNAIHRAFGDHRLPGTAGRMVWRINGNCTSPVHLIKEKEIDIEMQVRCRHCPGCLRARQHLWRLRAEWETMHARSWFFTGTWADQFYDIETWNVECTKWLKRVRKRCTTKGVSVRYLMVPEQHKSGKLHMHALVHELRTSEDAGTLTYRDLTSSWQAGFNDCKLTDWRTAGYVTKYTTKKLGETTTGQRPRIRASRGYGAEVMERDSDKLLEILRNKPDIKDHEIWTANLKQILRETKCQPRNLLEQMTSASRTP